MLKIKDSNDAVYAHYTWRPSHQAHPDRTRNSMKIQNTPVQNTRGRSERYLAHVTTVSLSWLVQNIAVIGRAHSKLERSEPPSNPEPDRNMLSGMGAWSVQNWVYTPPGRTPTHRSVLYFKQQHTCSNRPAILYTYGYVHWHIQ